MVEGTRAGAVELLLHKIAEVDVLHDLYNFVLWTEDHHQNIHK